MIWFVIILAVVIGGAVGLLTRNVIKALGVGVTILIAGSVISILIVYSGIMGG